MKGDERVVTETGIYPGGRPGFETVVILIRGRTRREVEEERESVKTFWPPGGYGTFFQPVASFGDEWVCYGTRSKSCD